MVYKVDRVIRDVRVAIDENRHGEPLLKDGDLATLDLDVIIGKKIEEGVRRVVMAAPVTMIDGGDFLGDYVFWNTESGSVSGWIILPEDFMRLLVFKMSDWERPVYEVITDGSPIYALQHSRYKGVRGTPQRPVVAIVRRQEGKVLEFYSCRSEEADVEQALYYPLPRIDHCGGIEIPERLYRSVIYVVAGLTVATYGMAEQAGLLMELSKDLMR